MQRTITTCDHCEVEIQPGQRAVDLNLSVRAVDGRSAWRTKNWHEECVANLDINDVLEEASAEIPEPVDPVAPEQS